jgi:hypothetical protein
MTALEQQQVILNQAIQKLTDVLIERLPPVDPGPEPFAPGFEVKDGPLVELPRDPTEELPPPDFGDLPRDKHGRCSHCGGTGYLDIGGTMYCNCSVGLDLRRIETRRDSQQEPAK